MGTYTEIINWIKSHPDYGWVAKTCWIAHCKELAGLLAHNRRGNHRIVPCPPEKREAIFAAFRYFLMI